MTFRYGSVSLSRLAGVHPHLVEIAHEGLKASALDITIVCGVRTVDEQVELFSHGRTTQEMREAGIYDVRGKPDLRQVTWTLNSNHFIRPQTGKGHAIDVAPWVGGKIEWNNYGAYDEIARAFFAVASAKGYPLEWGGHWVKKDRPHFQLPKGYGG